MFEDPKSPFLLDTILEFIGVQYDSWPFSFLCDLSFTNICLYSLCDDEGAKKTDTFQIFLLALVGRHGYWL
jgi:hypothetical protein